MDQSPEEKNLYRLSVQYRTAGKIYPCLAHENSYSQGDKVTIKGENGTSVATVIELPQTANQKQTAEIQYRVLHRASASEIERDIALQEKALSFLGTCAQKIKDRNLAMKLTHAEMAEDGKKVVFIFYAEQRVDFRSLVKELGSELRLRIEMRQIGARDETKYKGCLGACGQVTTCCSTFLRHFQSISIGMAKNQGLSPNPSKLTGMCGKLKCCLAYENGQYIESRKGLFKIGTVIETSKGVGKICNIDILQRKYLVQLDEGSEEYFAAEKCTALAGSKKVARERVIKQKREEGKQRELQQKERLEKRQQKFDAIASSVKKKAEHRKKKHDQQS